MKEELLDFLFFFFILVQCLALLLFFVSSVLVEKRQDIEKLSAYECGFDPFGSARVVFDVRFYLVSILFIIFDLEITFLFPWAVVVFDVGFWGFFLVIFFLLILAAGFYFEWFMGALDW